MTIDLRLSESVNMKGQVFASNRGSEKVSGIELSVTGECSLVAPEVLTLGAGERVLVALLRGGLGGGVARRGSVSLAVDGQPVVTKSYSRP